MTYPIEWIAASPVNFAATRQGMPILGTICHWVGAGTMDQAIAYFQTPRPANPTSAHFIVGTTGRIVQMVSELDTAYHAGDLQTNLTTIGIEHEAHPGLAPTDALYAASAWLHRRLADQFGFPLTAGSTVRPHSVIVPTTCPGSLSLDRIVEEANMAYDLATDPVFIAYQANVRDTINAMKDELARQAHHRHTTGEPTA